MALSYALLRQQEVILTHEQLARYTGEHQRLSYLAILGTVFDVSRNPSMYGSGGAYNSFVGKDGSRAFATGKFGTDDHDDVEDLTEGQLASILDWQEFYRQDYRAVGKVAGRFYDDMGRATALLTRIQAVKAPRRPPQRAATPGTQSCKMRWDATARTISCGQGLFPRNTGNTGLRECTCFPSTLFGPDRRLYDDCKPDDSICVSAAAALKAPPTP